MNVMNRHPGRRRADGLDASRSRAAGGSSSGIGIGGAPKEHEAYGIDFPAAPERVARLEEAVAVIRALWTGGPVTRDSPFYPLRDAVRPPGAGAAAPDHRRRRDAGRRAAGRADRRRLVRVRRQLRGEPAALPRIAGGSGPAARGPAGHRRVPGRLAERRVDRRLAVGRRRRARPGSAGRRPAPTGPSSWPGRRPTSTRWSRRPSAGSRRSWHHQPVTSPRTAPPERHQADRADPRLRPVRRAGRRSMSGCASAATRSGCATRRRRRSTASRSAGSSLFVVILAIVGRLALAGIGPFEASVAGVVPDGDGLAITLTVTNEGSSAGQTTCRVTDPADRTGNTGGVPAEPADRGRPDRHVHPDGHRARDRGPAARGRVQRAVTATATAAHGASALRRRAGLRARPRASGPGPS